MDVAIQVSDPWFIRWYLRVLPESARANVLETCLVMGAKAYEHGTALHADTRTLDAVRAVLAEQATQAFADGRQAAASEIQRLEAMLAEARAQVSTLLEQRNQDTVRAKTPVFSGQDGEALVRRIVAAYLSDWEVTDTSKQAWAGDMSLASENTHVLVETKNKASISRSDITKFERDVAEPNISAGIFISLASPNIPTKGSFCAVFTGPKPVLYLAYASLDEARASLGVHVAGFALLVKAQQSSAQAEPTRSDPNSDVRDICESLLDVLGANEKIIKSSLKHAHALVSAIEKMMATNARIWSKLAELPQ